MSEEEMNPKYLTSLFQANDILQNSNSVVSMTKELQLSEGSLAFSSLLKYHKNNNNLPQTIFIKLDKIRSTKHYKNLMRNEIDYYHMTQKYKMDYMPKILAGSYNDEFSYLILENYSNSHFVNTYETNIEFYKLAAKKIAEHHYICRELNLPTLYQDKYSPMSYKFVDLKSILYNHKQMVCLLGDSLTNKNKDILESVLCKLEENIDSINNYLAYKQHTIIHGDYHLRNCLFNKKNIETNMLIIDWQWCNIGIGTYDMAHLLNLYLPNKYKEKELEILKIYYNKLKELKYNYSWQECLEDYKIFTMLNLFKPAYYAVTCKLRRKTKFWAEFLNSIIISYNNLASNAD
ncbi:hypothetical protein AN1V17_39550 [Vallitalea sediminicola]